MELNEYQKAAKSTAVYPEAAHIFSYSEPSRIKDLSEWFYLVTKLNGEAGELAEEVAKALRDYEGYIGMDRLDRIVQELGDVLWYVAMLADKTGLGLEGVARANVDKLRSRQERGKLHGDGSNR